MELFKIGAVWVHGLGVENDVAAQFYLQVYLTLIRAALGGWGGGQPPTLIALSGYKSVHCECF